MAIRMNFSRLVRGHVFLAFAAVSPLANAAPNAADQAALDLIKRIAPAQAEQFEVDTSLPKAGGKDTFCVSDATDGKILLRGNNGVSVASAFNWYLKSRAHCHLSWCGDQLNFPVPLPKVGEPVTVTAPGQYRVYFNYCTFSYSAAWWNWERWQREIDFMALQGINTPLSVTGLEGVWYDTLLKFNFTDEEARKFLVGPAFFAWQWMTNIESHAGPLPKSWIDAHVKLGQQILARERALGMTPIQQGYSGYVPRLMAEKFPAAAIKIGRSWCGFPGSAQLDPLDPLFERIGKTFLTEQERLFGTSHLYGCDPFHEGRPPSDEPEYLAKVGRKIQAVLDGQDPHSTWVMQSWSIRQPIATAVPKDRLLIVDLKGQKHTSTEAFWGYPFVSGRLHNFGNRINLHGDLGALAANPFTAIAREFPNSAGLGLFMEGIIQNPVYYELAFDSIWRSGPVEPVAWLHDYARRRYGGDSESARRAWELLLETAYRPGTDGTENSSVICARPAINVKKSGPNAGFKIPYDEKKLLEAWRLLLRDGDQLKGSDGYLYDIVDIGRQVLSNHGQTLQKRIQTAFAAKDVAAFDQASRDFLQLLDDVDALLAPRPEFSFGKWIADARSRGTDEAEKDLYELNARALVTLWGPLDEASIFDYSWREWSGLIRTYYRVRWEKFLTHVSELLKKGAPYEEAGLAQQFGHEAWRANDFYKQLAEWESTWVRTPAVVDPRPQGDALELARAFLAKYEGAIASAESTSQNLGADFGKLVGRWSPEKPAERGQPFSVPVTTALDGEGTYAVTFRSNSAMAKLSISAVELLENGKVIAKDAHEGFAGRKHRENCYVLKLSSRAFGTEYALRVTAETEGDQAAGSIFLRKEP